MLKIYTIQEAIDITIGTENSAGRDVYMPVIVEVPVALLDTEVWEELPFRINDEGEVVTFKNWGGLNFQPINTHVNGEKVLLICTLNLAYLPSSVWIQFHQKGYTLYNSNDYNTLMASGDWV